MVDALATKGIIEPFPIQEQTIPLGLSGQDIIGQAKTGTGKTLGFGLPLLQALGTDPEPGVKALVVVPTRELCVQVAEDLVLAASNRATRSSRSTAARPMKARSPSSRMARRLSWEHRGACSTSRRSACSR